MQSKVRLKKTQLNYFRKLARDSKKEILALLIGEVISPELTRVDYFWYPEYAKQTTTCVQADAESFAHLKTKAESKNLRVIGTIHSHGDWVPIMSASDHYGHVADGDRISGIVGTQGRKTRAYFWVAESALPVKIEYV